MIINQNMHNVCSDLSFYFNITMKRARKPFIVALIISLLITVSICYLSYRTLKREILLQDYHQQTIALNNSKQIELSVLSILNNRASHLSTLANLIQSDVSNLQQLFKMDNEIDNIFILEGNKLIYPDEINPIDNKQREWIRLITPIINDKSLLYNNLILDEHTIPQSGWYINKDSDLPCLLFWLKHGNKTIGLRTSYIMFISNVINQLTNNYSPDLFILKEGGRIIYQSQGTIKPEDSMLRASIHLPYPLVDWQINYYSNSKGDVNLLVWGSLLTALIIILILLIILRIYREYTQTVRQAQQQVNFVSQVSHELKTPLTNIALYAEILKEKIFDEDNQAQQYLNVITSETERLTRLIQNILTFTKSAKVIIKPIEINTVLELIYQTFLPAFNMKGMTLRLIMKDKIIINTDTDKLIQIIGNFLSNAEKYASQGKFVDIILTQDEKSAYISVRDYGEGIAQKEMKAIFQPFYRIKSSITEGIAGTGIGLTIAQQMAKHLNGEIIIKNCSPGICFTLKQPLYTVITHNN